MVARVLYEASTAGRPVAMVTPSIETIEKYPSTLRSLCDFVRRSMQIWCQFQSCCMQYVLVSDLKDTMVMVSRYFSPNIQQYGKIAKIEELQKLGAVSGISKFAFLKPDS